MWYSPQSPSPVQSSASPPPASTWATRRPANRRPSSRSLRVWLAEGRPTPSAPRAAPSRARNRRRPSTRPRPAGSSPTAPGRRRDTWHGSPAARRAGAGHLVEGRERGDAGVGDPRVALQLAELTSLSAVGAQSVARPKHCSAIAPLAAVVVNVRNGPCGPRRRAPRTRQAAEVAGT